MKTYYITALLSVALLSGCGHRVHSHDHDQIAEGHDHEVHDHAAHSHAHGEGCSHNHPAGVSVSDHDHDQLIELTPEKAAQIGIVTARVAEGPFQEVIPAIGEILPMQGDRVTVTAKNEGFVRFSGKNLSPGVSVGNGERVMVITTEGVTQENYTERVAQAGIELARLREAYGRNLELSEDRLVTASELMTSRAEFEAAQLRYDNLIEGYEGNGLRVNAPIDGFVTENFVSEGDFVQVGAPLFTVARNRNFTLKAEVSPGYASRLPDIVSANFRTSASSPFRSVSESGGRLISYGRSVDSESLLIPVFFELPYRVDYVTGTYAEVNLLSNSGRERITLPNEAIVEDFGHFFVYVTEEHGFERRDISVGGTDGLRTEVLSGIRPGEEVVVNGATRLKLIERLGALGADAAHAGHSH